MWVSLSFLTHLAYIAMVKNRVLFCNNSLGRYAWSYLAPFYDIILSIDHVSLTLDRVTSFLHVINIRNKCKRLRYSQTLGTISSVQWRKVGRIWRIRLLFHRLLCVRIKIDQPLCVNCWAIIHCLSVSCYKQINHLCFALVICGVSSEFVSSSIPSWQILTAHAQPFRGARDLAFCLKVPLDSLLVWASSGRSGATAGMRRLAWTIAARIGDKYQIRLMQPIWSPLQLTFKQWIITQQFTGRADLFLN